MKDINKDEQGIDVPSDSDATVSFRTLWLLRFLKFVLWLCIWGVFVELQFGAVFFALSLICFMYLCTRTGPKDNNLSAYSVFNENCEQIPGTLTAEKMQKTMFGVPGLST